MVRKLVLLGLVIAAGAATAAWWFTARSYDVTQVAWASQSASLVFDHHVHTRYSDGALDLRAAVQLASDNGCDAVAITDHSDVGGSISDVKFAELDRLRTEFPQLLILAGVELEMPSYDGREHVNAIATPAVERMLLPALMDAINGEGEGQRQEELALALIHDATSDHAVAIYNHPSRKDPQTGENARDLRRWQAVSNSLIAMAGAPGHQNTEPVGSYEQPLLTRHRWDPAVAEVGGEWDGMLDAGMRVWGAVASSDYHNSSLDLPPCGFSRIHVATPTDDYSGLLQGLVAGTFWADHGLLLDDLQLRLDIHSVRRPLYPGAVAQVPEDEVLGTVSLRAVPGSAFADARLRFDVISSCAGAPAEVVASGTLPQKSGAVQKLIAIDAASAGPRCHVRARILHGDPESGELAAYTNPILLEF